VRTFGRKESASRRWYTELRGQILREPSLVGYNVSSRWTWLGCWRRGLWHILRRRHRPGTGLRRRRRIWLVCSRRCRNCPCRSYFSSVLQQGSSILRSIGLRSRACWLFGPGWTKRAVRVNLDWRHILWDWREDCQSRRYLYLYEVEAEMWWLRPAD
jgi:hypothetical protein